MNLPVIFKNKTTNLILAVLTSAISMLYPFNNALAAPEAIASSDIALQVAEDVQRIDKVKVGFFSFDGYHELDKDGNKGGLGFDFLQLTKRYAGIKYEYVGYDKTWSQMLEMLESGEIDMVTAAGKTSARAEKFAFSRPIGSDSMLLSTRVDEKRFVADEFSTYNGMKIGVLRGSSYNDKLATFAKEKGFSYVPVYFENNLALEEALQNKQLDAVCNSSLRRMNNEVVLNTFATEYYYAIVRKDNTRLLNKINYAIAQMDNNEGDWRGQLYYKNYIEANARKLYFTPVEQQYIKEHSKGGKKVVLATDMNWEPFSIYKDGAFEGIVPEYWDHIMKLAGMEYEYYKDNTKFCDCKVLQDKKVDLYLGYSLNNTEADKQGLIASPSYMNVGVAYIRKKGNASLNTIALSDTTPLLNGTIKPYGEQKLVKADNSDAAVAMVKAGKVDAAYAYAMDAERIINRDASNTLEMNLVPGVELYLQAVASEDKDHILMSIVSKCIKATDPQLVSSLASKRLSYNASELTLRDWVNMHPIASAAALLALVGAAGAAWTINQRTKNKLKLEEEKRKIESAMLEKETALVKQLEDSLSENEAQLQEINALNTQLQENQASLEAAGVEQEAQIEEISALNSELQDNQERIEQQMAILQSMNKVYYMSYYINLVEDTYIALKKYEKVSSLLDNNGGAAETFGKYYGLVKDCKFSTVAEVHEFFDLTTLNERMKAKSVISIDCLGAVSGYCQAIFIAGERDEQDNLKTVFLAVREINELKQKELDYQKKLESAVEAARQANAAKSDFLSRMSHDIRTPMNVVVGMTEIANRHLKDTARVKDCLDKINLESVHLQTLINDVLDISAIESGKLTIKPEEIRVKDIVDNMDVSVRSLVQTKSIDYIYEPGDIFFPYVEADSLRISQVYLNLLSNSVKYTPAGGRVKFEVWQELSDQKDIVELHARVSDTGMGMSKEFMQNMYSEFSRAVDSRVNKIQGTGLGLSIVKQIVDLMKGKIEVESELNKGTTFHVILPVKLVAKTDAKKTMVEDAVDYTRLKDLKVLIAEDNDLNYEIAYELLGDYDMHISRAEDGAIALDLMKAAEPGTYDLILMDMQMPVMNGLESTRAIRALDSEYAKRIPIIAMTANAFAEDALACREAGMDSHVAKPINVKFLLETIVRVLEEKKN